MNTRTASSSASDPRLAPPSLQLHPEHPLLWRAGGRLQVGLQHPVVFDDPSPGIESLLVALQSGVTDDELRRRAERGGLTPASVEGLLAQLGDRCQRTPQPLSLHRLWNVRPSHSLAEHHRATEHVQRAQVAVTGHGSLPAAILRTLAASGCATLHHRPDPAVPHGLDGSPHPADRCHRLPAEAALRQPVSPGAWHQHDAQIAELYDCAITTGDDAHDDLTIVCGYGPPHPAQWTPLLRDDRVHLSVWATATGAIVVGPLVVPGQTGCLGCVHQHARDQIDDWALICDQMWRRARLAPLPTDVALATSLAVRCALDALAASPSRLPQIWNRRVVVHDGQTRLLAHEPHPRCLCRDQPFDEAISAPRETSTA
ncbi:hypothetical protein [Pseudoclavibacter sp. 13-3]|uniref:hypothetical protein n=1 Tax=Pseudoclavibacter sp. 13-3 TaxID=2901228 RepID=UPI001E52977C|nr:hypothetical protein [Pseudoclavibacter sp. 13-3]MCD7102202.1 hypothetical protein [Pseudoclavibacter sp. 13-3]